MTTSFARSILPTTLGASSRMRTRRAEAVDGPGLEALWSAVPNGRLVTSPAAIAGLIVAPGLTAQALPRAVALPETTEEVARLVKAARAGGLTLTVRGAGTAPARTGRTAAVVIVMSRMRRLIACEPGAGCIDVEAGATIAAVNQAIRPSGLVLPCALDVPQIASVGAAIAAGRAAGGARGSRALVNAVSGGTLVLPDGRIMRLGSAAPSSSADPLLHALIGLCAEGAILTRAWIACAPRPEAMCNIEAIWPGWAEAQRAVSALEMSVAAIDDAVISDARAPRRRLTDRLSQPGADGAANNGATAMSGAVKVAVTICGARDEIDDLAELATDQLSADGASEIARSECSDAATSLAAQRRQAWWLAGLRRADARSFALHVPVTACSGAREAALEHAAELGLGATSLIEPLTGRLLLQTTHPGGARGGVRDGELAACLTEVAANAGGLIVNLDRRAPVPALPAVWPRSGDGAEWDRELAQSLLSEGGAGSDVVQRVRGHASAARTVETDVISDLSAAFGDEGAPVDVDRTDDAPGEAGGL